MFLLKLCFSSFDVLVCSVLDRGLWGDEKSTSWKGKESSDFGGRYDNELESLLLLFC